MFIVKLSALIFFIGSTIFANPYRVKSGIASIAGTIKVGQNTLWSAHICPNGGIEEDGGWHIVGTEFVADPGITLVSTSCNPVITLTDTSCCDLNLSFSATKTGRFQGGLKMQYTILGVPNTSDYLWYTAIFDVIDDSEPPLCKTTISGSIIGMNVGSVGEEIPVVGVPFKMIYNTEYSIDYPATARMPKNPFFGPEMLIPSIQYFYDTNSGRIYGEGSSSKAEATVLPSSNLRVVSPTKDEIYIFSSTGKHLETRSFLTGYLKFTFNYDGSNKLSSIVDAFGNTTTFQRAAGKLSGILSPFSQLTSVYTNVAGLVSSVVNPNGETYSITYKAGTELMDTFTLPRGQVSTFTYTSSNKLLKDSSSAGNFWQFTRTPTTLGETVTQVSQMGRSTTFSPSKNGQLVLTSTQHPWGEYTSTSEGPAYFESIDADGTVRRTIANDSRFGTAKKRVSQNKVTIGGVSFDTNYSESVNPASPSDPFTYTSLTTQTTIAGNTWQSVYTASVKTEQTSSPAGATTTKIIDSYERPVYFRLGSDIAETFSYNSIGQLTGSSQGAKNSKVYTYNSKGLLQSVTNALSEVTSFGYDLANRLTSITFPDTRSVAFTYDANGNQTSVSPPSKPMHSFTYNLFDLTSAYQPPPLSGVSVVHTTYTYNNDKQLIQITRPTGDVASYNYVLATSLLSSISTPAGSLSYTYISGSRKIQNLTSAPGDIKDTFTYYGNQLKSDIQYTNSSNYINGGVTFNYDSQHRRSSRVVRGNSASTTYTTNYTYNADSMPTVIGSLGLAYSYPSGRLSTTTIDKISDVRTYDSYGHLASYTATYTPTSGPAVTLYSYTLTRDLIHRIVGKSETIGGVTDNYVYSFDNSGRLTTVTKNGSAYSSYVYDNNGNRTSGVVAGTAFTATYDNQDRMLTHNSKIYTYNANGDNTQINWGAAGTSTYVYDVFGNLTKATLTTGNVYDFYLDGLGRRTRKTENGTQKFRFVYEDELRATLSVSSGIIQKEYVFGLEGATPEYMNSYVSNIGTYKIIKDHLGSPRLVVNVSTGVTIQRMDYNDLGEVVADTNAGFQPYGFAGGIYDSNTKTVKFGAREYDPRSLGRWMTKDPILFAGGDANLYGYVMSDPVNFIDPKGLQASAEKDLWARLPEVVDFWLRQWPREKVKEKKRINEELEFKFPPVATPRVPLLPSPFSPISTPPQTGGQCE